MFADFRVHGLNTTFSNAFTTVYTDLQEKKKEGLPPDFLWSLVALANLMRLSLRKTAPAAVGECHVPSQLFIRGELQISSTLLSLTTT
jgi:hypothetical protein